MRGLKVGDRVAYAGPIGGYCEVRLIQADHGNTYMLGGAFAYDGRLNRGVTVSTAAITEALENVYQDHELVKELRAAQ